jgi:hypothetical protein
VASDEIELTLDVEAILDDELERTGAIAYYRDSSRQAPAGAPASDAEGA